MNRYALCLMCLLVFVLGCGGGKSAETGDTPATTLDDVGTGMQVLLKNDKEHEKELKSIKNSLKGKEFRGLSQGIRIGESGVLRIDISSDDEGNDLVSPAQVAEAVIDAGDELRAVACKPPGSGPVAKPLPKKASPFGGGKPKGRTPAGGPAPGSPPST